MRHMEDKRCCPHCGEDFDQRPYLMARSATENVLSLTQIAWVIVSILVLAMGFMLGLG